LQERSDVVSGSWGNSALPVAVANGTNYSATNNILTDKMFYRLKY